MTTETGFDAHMWLARWEAQQADLAAPGWVDRVGDAGFDAAVAATALHRLPADALAERNAGDHGGHGGSTLGQWERALRAAGFDEVTTVTQLLDRRLLAALR